MSSAKLDNAKGMGMILSGLGLALLLAGLIAGVYPLLPLTTGAGPMQGVPQWAAWQWGGLAGAGVGLMVWGRMRASS